MANQSHADGSDAILVQQAGLHERERAAAVSRRDRPSGEPPGGAGAHPRSAYRAPGGPGIEPRWTRGHKTAVGTAYSSSSRIWYTLDHGAITEVYYPTIDSPQIRDLQFMFTDGETFFHDERRNFHGTIDCVGGAALGFDITNREREGRYTIHKTVIGDPHQNCLLVRARLEAPEDLLRKLRMYVLCAPHLEIGGWGNNGEIVRKQGYTFLTAHKGLTWLVIGATIPFTECSCGFVGVNDGWNDLARNLRLDWHYESAIDGNIALTGGLDLSAGTEFTVALGFGTTRHNAMSAVAQSLTVPFDVHREAFIRQWDRTSKRYAGAKIAGTLYERSVNLLLAHEDKSYPGAVIASLSIPWGDVKGDEELGGYHLVWTRDLVKAVSALRAVNDLGTPLRALIYLAVSQREDGGFAQSSWLDGRPYARNVQLDEVAFPVLLAWRLWAAGALGGFSAYEMVRSACGLLVREGPVTAQERWEEMAGYSPSTLAVHIAALVCGAEFFAQRGDDATATFLREYADFLEAHVERWTVTTEGTLVPGIARHYIRLNPGAIDRCADGDPNHATIRLPNQAPGARAEFPAKEIVDGGFLELVRYGIRDPHDPIIEDSIRVIDAVLKVDTPVGPCWHRYSHDGYGERDDGRSYAGWGKGRAWPLLTGERGHYELAAGRDPAPYLRALEGFAHGIGLIPEQIWDTADLPERHFRFGGPTNAAVPLLWAHSEYVKLHRSRADGRVFDLIEPVYARYVRGEGHRKRMEVWKFNRQIASISSGTLLRIQAASPFQLRWTADEWRSDTIAVSTSTGIGIDFVDVIAPAKQASLRFRFFWVQEDRWEDVSYAVEVRPDAANASTLRE